jgi:hypothetical protein
MIAALMTEAVASGTPFEDVASLGVFPREHSFPELQVTQLGDRNESRCVHLVRKCFIAALAENVEQLAVGTNISRNVSIGTAALNVFRGYFPLRHECFAPVSVLVEFLEGEESVVLY